MKWIHRQNADFSTLHELFKDCICWKFTISIRYAFVHVYFIHNTHAFTPSLSLALTHLLKAQIEQRVGLIQHQSLHAGSVQVTSLQMRGQPSWRAHNYMYASRERGPLIFFFWMFEEIKQTRWNRKEYSLVIIAIYNQDRCENGDSIFTTYRWNCLCSIHSLDHASWPHRSQALPAPLLNLHRATEFAPPIERQVLL